MSEYNKTILTNDGLALVAKANKGTTKFTITRAATSAEKLADKSIAELQQLTELPSLMQYGVINDVSDMAQDSNTVIGTELVFNNKDLANSYNINAIGLFAKEEGSTKEILYALTTASTPESMPDFNNKVLFKFNMTMFVAIAQADNVTVNVNDNGIVTKLELASKLESLEKKLQIAIENAGQVKKVNDHEPDDKGNVILPSIEHPNRMYARNEEVDIDNLTETGIYHFMDAKVIASIKKDALDGLPKTTDGTTMCGYLFVMRHDDYNREQVLLLNGGATDVVMATRSISGTNSWRACFRRLLNIDDFNTLWNRISTVENKELVHQCDDLDSGVAYSKANPNVFVATP